MNRREALKRLLAVPAALVGLQSLPAKTATFTASSAEPDIWFAIAERRALLRSLDVEPDRITCSRATLNEISRVCFSHTLVYDTLTRSWDVDGMRWWPDESMVLNRFGLRGPLKPRGNSGGWVVV